MTYGQGDGSRGLLQAYCSAMVPLYMLEIEQRGGGLDNALIEQASRDGQIVAEKGDTILFKVKGESSKAVSALVRGLATLAYCPGGVTYMGMHFEVSEERPLTRPPLDDAMLASLEEWRAALDRAEAQGDEEEVAKQIDQLPESQGHDVPTDA